MAIDTRDPRISTEQHERSWQLWSAAWDSTRDADQVAGRRYDKDRYHDAATAARISYLAECIATFEGCIHCSGPHAFDICDRIQSVTEQ